MKYELIFSDQSKDDLSRLKKDEPQAFRKARKMLLELMDHPTTGTGRPELLKGSRSGQWSRRISQKHRLVYEILDTKILIYILSAWGHYDDK